MRTQNIDQAIEAVSKVYCPHTIKITGRASGIDSVLEILRPGPQPLVHLSYAAPVKVDAEDFPHLFLAIHSTCGAAAVRQNERLAEWHAGQTMLFSAGLETQFHFDRDFAQTSVRLDIDMLEATCARWLGHPLERRLRFTLRPFAPTLETEWRRVLAFLADQQAGASPPEGPARQAFDEYLLTLVLQHHPHNHSEEMNRDAAAPSPGIVRRAERFMRDNVEAPLTIAGIAAELGVGVRTLQAAFRTWRSTTPSAFLRDLRLQRVREELRQGDTSAFVTDVALRAGFTHLGRFSAAYRQTFGESPNTTRRRALNRPMALSVAKK
jgi:AraC-like DNA-binding protein